MLRDEWELLDSQEQPIGVLIEDSSTQAFLRRFLLSTLLPQNYDILIYDSRVADFRQHFSLYRYDLELDFSRDTMHQLDRRLGIAAGILLGTIEGKQDS
jgi:hypothetical protein